jgi:predicted heme/steroid binding protein
MFQDTDTQKKLLVLVASIVVVTGILAFGIYTFNSAQASEGSSESSSYDDGLFRLTLAELKEYDGKEGRKCLVAYENDVYSVNQAFSYAWSQGEFLPGSGRVFCGQDVTLPIQQEEELKGLMDNETKKEKIGVVVEE